MISGPAAVWLASLVGVYLMGWLTFFVVRMRRTDRVSVPWTPLLGGLVIVLAAWFTFCRQIGR